MLNGYQRRGEAAYRHIVAGFCLAAMAMLATGVGVAKAGNVKIPIGYLIVEVERPLPISRLDTPPEDDGVAGAQLAIKDNNTTGRFTKQEFSLEVVRVPDAAKAVEALARLVDTGHHFVLVDASADDLLKLADAVKDQHVVLFNVRATDTRLRDEDCRANVFHIAPSRAMLADALAQYLVWKKWTRWFLVRGALPADNAFADAMKRAATRFGAKIVEEREYKEERGARRTDTGHALIQKQMAVFTQGASEHDVLVVADESEVFGPYVPYRQWTPRPVVGTSGLFATSWHPSMELWGGTQLNNRFERAAKRHMRPLDYLAWVAARVVGEAATRTRSGDFMALRDYILGPSFEIAAFKGQPLTFRKWNHQLRQPIVLANLQLLVSVSPQPGFLHQGAEVDTLGVDAPETKCKFN